MLSPSFIFRPTGTGNIGNDKTRLGALRLDRSRPLKVRPGCRYICWHPPSARLRAYLRSAVARPLPVALTYDEGIANERSVESLAVLLLDAVTLVANEWTSVRVEVAVWHTPEMRLAGRRFPEVWSSECCVLDHDR